jgi:hypothetical protein
LPVRSSRGVRLAFRDVGSGPRFQGSDDPRGSSVTGGWPSPFPPRPYPLPGGSSRSSARSATSGLNRPSYPLAFSSPSERLSRADRLSPVSSPGIRRTACSRAQPPYRPSVDRLHRVHSRPTLPSGFGPELPRSDSRSALVVLHHLGGFLRVGVAGLLHPATDPGVRRVSCGDRRELPKQPWSIVAFPDDAHHTPRRTPSTAAVLRHRSRCPLVVSASFEAVDLEALLHRRVRDVATPLPVTRILSSLGFVPLQGPLRVSRDRPRDSLAPSAPDTSSELLIIRPSTEVGGGPRAAEAARALGLHTTEAVRGAARSQVAEATGNKPRIGRPSEDGRSGTDSVGIPPSVHEPTKANPGWSMRLESVRSWSS